MTLSQKILSTALGAIALSVTLSVLGAGYLHYSTLNNDLDFSEKASSASITKLGTSLTTTTSQAIATLIHSQDIDSIRAIIASTVKLNSHITYGAYLDEDLVPWAIATPTNPQGIPESLDSLADENSLWGSELQAASSLKTHINQRAVTLFASPVVIDREFRGAVYFATLDQPTQALTTPANKLFGVSTIFIIMLLIIAITCTLFIRRFISHYTHPVEDIKASINKALSTKTLIEIISNDKSSQLIKTYNVLAEQLNSDTRDHQLLTQASIELSETTTLSAAAITAAKTLYKCTEASIISVLAKGAANEQHIYLLENGRHHNDEILEKTARINAELDALIERALVTYAQQASQAPLQTADVLCNQQVSVVVLSIGRSDNRAGHILIINQSKDQNLQAPPLSDYFTKHLSQLLAVTITRINTHNMNKDKISRLAQDNQEAVRLLSKRKDDIDNLMKNLQEGMLIINEDGTIDGQHSQKLEQILNIKNVAGKHYKEVLFVNSGLSSSEIDRIMCTIDATLGSQEVMYAFNSHLLCEEISIIDPNGNNKRLQSQWSPIIEQGIITKLMLTLSDATHQDALERTTRAQKEELVLVGQVLKVNAQKFEELMHYAKTTLNRNVKLIRNHERCGTLDFDALFRNTHNIKKEARAQGLTHLTDSLHTIEARYDEIRKQLQADWRVADLLSDLQIITTKIERYKHINHDILKRTDHAAPPSINKEQLYTIASELKNLKPAISSRSGLTSLATIESILLDATTLDIAHLAHKRLEALAEVAGPLGKPSPSISVQPNDFRIHNKIKAPITDVFDKILRNCIYHSLEATIDRQKINKNEEGLIKFNLSEKAGNLIIRITDDGKGLNMKRLAEKGVNNGQITPTEAKNLSKVAELLFNKSVYTPSSPSIDSGYRYGIAQIKDTLTELGGNVSIEVVSPYLNDYCEVAIELSLPANLYMRASEQANPINTVASSL